ncbi:predicted protein [Chaetoceros tenuissimus]|uniref:Uncharacterized protein n=1 Tax=Chaetoceros tenuissimus TaxID=426638 RepID=A0AAD3CZC9_9STRA|nr:predicted protein [Chaetoceros tenuissimus]
MSCLQHKIEKVESFIPKLKALIDIAENHLHDPTLLGNLEFHMDNCVPGITGMDEKSFAPFVASALTRLSVSRPSVEVVEKLIDMFPSSLTFLSENGLLPLQHAAMNIASYIKYVHLFVRPSCSGYLYSSHVPAPPNVFTGQNILHHLVSTGYDCDDYEPIAMRFDESLANAIDHFCKQGFITKEDIENYKLLAHSCNKKCMRRFKCLARWHKEALKTSRVEDKPLLLYFLLEENFDSVEVFLQMSFQLFPDESGLLFFGDYSDQDHVHIYQILLGFSFYYTLAKVIRPISVPLLHQICKRSDVGRMLFVFGYHLPFLRRRLDKDGRCYYQAFFAYCQMARNRPSDSLVIRIDNLSSEKLETKDPVTGLLPFMAVAANNGSVGLIYELLLKHPTALVNCIKSSAGQKEKPMTLKRKRDDSN